jgi:hypothetical protein
LKSTEQLLATMGAGAASNALRSYGDKLFATACVNFNPVTGRII